MYYGETSHLINEQSNYLLLHRIIFGINSDVYFEV